MPTVEDYHASILAAACEELEGAYGRILHCTGQLSDEQIWSRPLDEMNSIGNLLLHLEGNLRQWVVCGLTGAKDKRTRPKEFSQREVIVRDELTMHLRKAVDEALAAIGESTPEGMVAPKRIQGFETDGFGAVFHSLSHFRGHVQEIIHMTRFLLKEDYQYAWQPTTKEQGAG